MMSTSDTSRRSGSTRVLIVDDEPFLREVLQLTLDDPNLELHDASNGTEAATKALRLKPDLVILDVIMPGGMQGFEVCKWIKNSPELRNTRVVILTARSDPKDPDRAIEAGADAFMRKPFSPLELLETTRVLLRKW